MRNDSSYFARMYEESKNTYRISGLTRFTFWRKSAVAFDLGSNVGTFSLVYAKFFDRILAGEASSQCVKESEKRIEKAGLSNVEVIHAALAKKSGDWVELHRVYVGEEFESKDFTTLTWDTSEVDNSCSGARRGEIEERVRSISWNELIEKVGDSQVDFVKCDIEGAEYDLFINQDLSPIKFLIMELHWAGLGKKRTRDLVVHLTQYMEFFIPEQRDSFLIEWPPPEILRMIRPNHNQRIQILDRVIFRGRVSGSYFKKKLKLIGRKFHLSS